MAMPTAMRWRDIVREIYADDPDAASAHALLEEVMRPHLSSRPATSLWDEHDAWMITYPDQFRSVRGRPLETLRRFHETHLAPTINGIHVLPFFPWSSDDGYSILDYEAVDERHGTWADIEALGERTRLMVDAVINHMSARSEWFQGFLGGVPEYGAFFRTADPAADVSQVTRPRESPLLTEFPSAGGVKTVWTTFSADQVDLDYRNPRVLARIIDVILGYAARGARVVRLDAVCFVWKEEGTTSIHLRETHLIVQLIRAILEATYPGTVLVTETNVPESENLSYFGDGGTPEAHAVYQFALPPLVLHSFLTGDASALKRWAATATPVVPETTFLNFLASHDGVGLRPAEGLLEATDVRRLITAAEAGGGRIGRRVDRGGTAIPYELNATWFDLMNDAAGEDATLARHLASHAIMFALRGIPAVYVHSLFAGRNDIEAMVRTGAGRAVNRRKFEDADALAMRLADDSSLEARCWNGLAEMLEWRRSSRAFHPDAAQSIPSMPPNVIGIERRHADGTRAQVYVNVSDRTVDLAVPLGEQTVHGTAARTGANGIGLGPWGTAWVLD
ncbi:MAG: sugar phosphorylase [Acidimicrobiia bacterium]